MNMAITNFTANDTEKRHRKARVQYANDLLCKADILHERAEREREKGIRIRNECRIMEVKYFLKSLAFYLVQQVKAGVLMLGRISKKISEFFNRAEV